MVDRLILAMAVVVALLLAVAAVALAPGCDDRDTELPVRDRLLPKIVVLPAGRPPA